MPTKFLHLCSAVLFLLFITSSIANASERKEIIEKEQRSANNDNGDDISQDLIALAQSYFIEPELPSSTTVKPTFKRRKTLRPISSLTEKKKGLNRDDPDISTLSQSSITPFNPFRQIVNTGFAKKRHSTQKPSHPDLNINSFTPEVNEIRVTTAKSSDNVLEQPTTVPSREVLRRRKTTTPGLIKLADNSAARQQATRFVSVSSSRRHNNKINGLSLGPTELTSTKAESYTSAAGYENVNQSNNKESMPSTPSPTSLAPPRGINSNSFRGGRQRGFILQHKLTVTPDPVGTENEIKGRQVRRKSNNITRPVSLSALSATEESEKIGRLKRRQGDKKEDSIIPIEASIKFESAPVDLVPNNFSKTAIKNHRGRGAGGKGPSINNQRPVTLIVNDSDHESSDPVPSSSVESVGALVMSTDPLHDTKPVNVLSNASYRPRNLSNRNSNANSTPLDKLSSRQAAASRFLIPKAKSNITEGTSAPVIAKPVTPSRKSPLLSLSNKRNQRLLGLTPTTTYTTTEQPIVSELSDAVQVVPRSNSTLVGDAEESPDNPQNREVAHEDNGGLNESDQSSSSLLGNKVRSPLKNPGGVLRKPFMPRANTSRFGSGVIHMSTTTTVRPAQETTPTPTCNDGKRYNKILKKCFPSYVHRFG